MKIVVYIVVCLLAISCSKEKDGSKPAILSLPASFENTKEIRVPDATMFTSLCGNKTKPSVVESIIAIDKSGTIKNVDKFSIELDLSHNAGGDLVVELIAPSGKSFGLLNRIGSTENDGCGIDVNFIGGNKLTFTSNQSFPAVSGSSGQIIGTGIYHATQGSTSFPNVIMLGSGVSLSNENIYGNWKLKVYDYGVGTSGSLVSWKLLFDVGVF